MPPKTETSFRAGSSPASSARAGAVANATATMRINGITGRRFMWCSFVSESSPAQWNRSRCQERVKGCATLRAGFSAGTSASCKRLAQPKRLDFCDGGRVPAEAGSAGPEPSAR